MAYSGDRRPSPPPQQHAALSYLSPSATPFTVTRPRDAAPDPVPNAPANPSPYPELPTAPSLYDSWVEPPASYMDLEAGAASGFRGFASSDGFLVAGSAQSDMYSGNHFGTPMQPLPFAADSSEWMEEKYPGIYQRTSKALSSDFGSAVAQQPSASHNMFACLEQKPCSTPQPVNQYSPYSDYGNYTSQIPSCSTYPLNYDLPMPSVASSPEVGAAIKPLSPTTDGHVLENAFPAQYMNPCRLNLDYFDTMQNEQKNLFGYQTSYKQYGDWSSSDNGTRMMGSYPLSKGGVGENHLLGESSKNGRPVQPGTYPLSRHGVGENYILGESSETGRPVQPSSEANSGLKNLQASCSKVSPSEYSFPQPRELFVESLEVNNPVVDSPCWKGTPTVQQQSFFGVVKNDEASVSANGSAGLPDSHQSENLSEFSTKKFVLLPKLHDTSNPENDLRVPDYLYHLSPFSMPSGYNKSEGYNNKQLSSVGDVSGMEKSISGHVSVDQGTRRDKHVTCKTGDDSGNVAAPGQHRNIFLAQNTNEPMLGRNVGSHVVGTSEESGKVSNNVGAAPIALARSMTKGSLEDLFCVHKAASAWANLHSKMPMKKGLEHLTNCNTGTEESVKISSDKVTCRSKSEEELIKSIYNLSVMLLSTCSGGYQLEESEHALVQSVIQNLSSLSSTISKASLKSDVTSNCCLTKSEKTKCNGKNHQLENIAWLGLENIGSDFKKAVLQDLAKFPEENVDGDTKDAQTIVYKNLWIEAEASMCKLKYELQLARMELASKNHSQRTAIAPTDSLEAKASNLHTPENSLSTGESVDSSKQQNPVKESHIHNTTLLPQGGDADVFARLQVLKLRDESINCFHEANSERQTETSKYNWTDLVDDTVFDNAVDARIASLVEDIIKERSEASSSGGNEADGATTGALNDFLSCNNNTSRLDEDTNIEQLEYSESKTHGAFMAKLKELMSCSDGISSSSEVNACQLQTASKNESSQFGQLEDGVMARLQVLKRRIDNTSSFEGEEVFDSDDWVGHFERKQFGRGGHDELIEKTDSSDNAEFRALSDEAESKTASQYVGSLLEECHVLSAPAEPPASVQLHDGQLSHSPSEWEHVLKEDFFLPGKPLK